MLLQQTTARSVWSVLKLQTWSMNGATVSPRTVDTDLHHAHRHLSTVSPALRLWPRNFLHVHVLQYVQYMYMCNMCNQGGARREGC